MKPLLLDLFCGAGGAAMGYHRAGFRVVGVDIAPQKHYPFQFVQMDALEFLRLYGKRFDAVHASPPCQRHSSLATLHRNNPNYRRHKDMISSTRDLLQKTGKPYIIENVPGAPLENPIMLCGTFFDLKVYRHRLFESSVLLLVSSHAPHRDNLRTNAKLSDKGYISVTGTGGFTQEAKVTACGVYANGFMSVVGHFGYLDYARYAMGIDWMSREELSQAIPPAYTEYVGRQLIRAV